MKIDQELVRYISRGRGAYVPDDKLRNILLGVGWSPVEVDAAMAEAGTALPIIRLDQPKKNSGGLGYGWIVILLLILAGIVFWFYFSKPNPDTQTKEMLEALAQVTDLSYEGQLKMDLEIKSNLISTSSSTVALPVNSLTSKRQTIFDFAGKVLAPISSAPRFDILGAWRTSELGTTTTAVDFAARLIDEKLYLKLAELTYPGVSATERLVGPWLAITPADMISLGFDHGFRGISANEFLAWRRFIASSQSLKLLPTDVVEEMGGVKTFKYDVIFDGQLAGEKADWLLGSMGLGDWLGDHDYLLADTRELVGQVWIDRQDLPRQLVLESKVDSASTDGGNQAAGNWRLLLIFNYDSVGGINAPEGAVPLLSVVELP